MEGEYESFLRREAVPRFLAHSGLAAVRVGVPTRESPNEFMVETVWKDLEALREFAGEKFLLAKASPGEEDMLDQAFVHHYADAEEYGGLTPPSILAARDDPARTPTGSTASSETLDLGRLRLDLRRSVAYVEGEMMELPPREFAVLLQLALHPEQPISAAQLARWLWPGSVWMTGDDVRRVVYRMRRAIRDNERSRPLVRNRRGYGYVLAV